MADEEVKISASEQKKEDWMNSKWRPMMGWMYMLVCTMDFVGFPVLWSLLQATVHGAVNVQWQPLTLQGAGLFHIAMGAVIGISAYGRTQEKMAGANNGGLGAGTTYTPPTSVNGGFSNGNTTAPATGFASGPATPSAPAAGGFGSTSSFSSPAASSFGGGGFGSAPATGFGSTPAVNASGKKVIPTFDQPAI
jgi:Holin of 3TMs, for gene-transfer release